MGEQAASELNDLETSLDAQKNGEAQAIHPRQKRKHAKPWFQSVFPPNAWRQWSLGGLIGVLLVGIGVGLITFRLLNAWRQWREQQVRPSHKPPNKATQVRFNPVHQIGENQAGKGLWAWFDGKNLPTSISTPISNWFRNLKNLTGGAASLPVPQGRSKQVRRPTAGLKQSVMPSGKRQK